MTPEQRAELIAVGWTPPPAPEPDWDACREALADIVETWGLETVSNDLRNGSPLNGFDKATILAIIKHADLWAEQARQLKDVKC